MKIIKAFVSFAAALVIAPFAACAATQSAVSVSDELKYPPIRLEVAESAFTPAQMNAKTELIQSSQVFEDALHMGGMVYKDPELEKRLLELIPENLLGERAKGFKYRIYLLRDPDMNAMATPTGSIYINSGLLATLSDFDQMRLVIAHEAYHVIDQDIVHQYQKIRSEVGALKVLQLIAAPAVAVAISESDSSTAATIANVYTAANIAVSISYQVSISGYGRENENECDQFALTLFEKNNYDYRSAREVFVRFEEEEAKYSKGFRYHLFRSHDGGKKRAEHVDKFLKEKGYALPAEPRPNDGYNRLTKNIRIENARLNVRLGRVQHALDDLERLEKATPDDVAIQCLFADAYAALSANPDILKEELSGKEYKKLKLPDKKTQIPAWAAKAKERYQKSLALDPSFADAHKGLALLGEAREEFSDAAGHYRRYLELKPEAPDRRYMKAKLDRLEKKMAEPPKTKKE